MVGVPLTPDSSDATFPQCHEQFTQDLRTSLPSACHWLRPEDVELVGKYPIAAGGVADIWKATYGGRRVVLKSHRRYVTVDDAQVTAVHFIRPTCIE